jgi:hypothetical protein
MPKTIINQKEDLRILEIPRKFDKTPKIVHEDELLSTLCTKCRDSLGIFPRNHVKVGEKLYAMMNICNLSERRRDNSLLGSPFCFPFFYCCALCLFVTR